MASVSVPERSGTSQQSKRKDLSLLEKQTHTRRLFLPSQLFFLSTTYLNTWIGVGVTMYYAFLNGGPAAYLFNYIIVLVGVMAQAATLAEFASLQPIAGAQYIWTYYYGPPRCRLFLTWIQGWTTWIGYMACLTSTINAQTIILQAVISMNFPSYTTQGWRTFLFDVAYLVLFACTNTYAFRLVPWFGLATGALSVTFFFVYLFTFWTQAPRNSATILLEMTSSSGWDNEFLSWNIGSLSQIWLFVGFECIIQMGQESKNPSTTVPKTMFWSVVANGLAGMLMVCTLLICMPSDLSVIIHSSSPLVTIIQHATGSDAMSTFLAAGQVALGIASSLSGFAAASRLTWAWARDGALPAYFSVVDGARRVPVRAVWLTAALCAGLALLNVGSATYAALGAITSLAVLGFYVSYAVVAGVALYARRRRGHGGAGALALARGAWTMGRWGGCVNAFALAFTLWAIVWIPFPASLPVTAANMNWSLPAYVAVMAIVTTIYMLGGHSWRGPNKTAVDIVLCEQ